MDDVQLLRYSRQVMLPQIDIEGQTSLLQSHVVIVGLGGLGSPAAMYLAAAGVGHLTLVDFDQVELSNIQRQILHGTHDIGKDKTQSAVETLKDINPDCKLSTYNHKLSLDEYLDLFASADVAIDATDNFESRFLINRACVTAHTPLVMGAAIRFEAQVSVFLNDEDSPCYRCLYRDDEQDLTETCSETGILAPITGIIGSIQALETIKVITKTGQTLSNRVLVFDAMQQNWREIKLKKDRACPVCSA